jgi:hypothetical protein
MRLSHQAMSAPSDSHSLDLSLCRALPHAELAISPSLSRDGPSPERASLFAS